MRISGKKGILSLLLSLVLVLELILSSGQIVLASSENHQDVYTVKILNEQGESVPGVKVVYDLYTDATGSDKKQETVDAVTGDDGVLEIAAISEAQQADGEAYYKIVEASGEGYDSYNDTEMQTITSENVLTEREITLKKTVQKQKVTLTGLVTNVQNSQPLENVFVSDGDAGSTITGSDGTYSIELIEGNSYELTFSLDGYDEVSKTVTVAAPYVCDVQMNLSAVYDSTFRFNDATPKSVVYGENENKFINVASSEMADSKITYAIVKEKDLEGSDTNVDVADINSQTGEVTIKRSGMITVEATRAADITYAETKITYELSVVKADQTGFKFEEEVPQDKKYYPADGTYSNAAVGGQSTGKITYKVIEGTGIAEVNTDTGEVTFKKLGTVGIQATKAGDDKYNEITATYRITAIKKGQTRFKFDTSVPSDLHYGENNNKYLNEAKGGNGTGEITYSVEDGKDIVSVDPKTGEVSFIKAGQATIKATKTKDENSFYETATATYTLNIAKGTQSTLHFVRQNPEITWDANNTSFENALQGGSGNGELSYEIIEQKRLNGEKADTSVATIDKSTGKLTILSTGTVKVKGTKAGDESYKEATAEYELTIKKADQSIAFQETTKTVVYGTKEYTSVMANTGTGTGEITYSIEGENVLGVSMNPSTGVIRFADNKTGSIVIKATKAEDEKYNACEANYTLTVEYLDTPENPYELSGNQIDAESGWYTGNITISAPEGYQISTESSLNGTSWSDSFVYDIEGNHDLTVYLKKVDSDEITGGIAVQGLKIDKGDPYNLEISYEKDSLIQQIKNFFFGKDKVTVTIKATDDVSGIKAFKYKYDSDTLSLSSQGKDETEVLAEDEKVQKNEDGTVSYSFDIQPQFRGKVSFKAIDYAGRVSEKADTENTVVVDDKSPKVKVTYAPVGEETTLKAKVKCDTAEEITRENKETADAETRFIYDGAIKATVKMTEANFYAEDVKVIVKKDGSEIWNGAVSSKETIKDGDTTLAKISKWTIDEVNDTEICEIIMQADGDYEISIEYKDRSLNELTYDTEEGNSGEYTGNVENSIYTSNIMTVDTTVPTVEVTYDNKDVNNASYYKADRTATIRIKDRNFRPGEVNFVVTAKDVQEKESDTYAYSQLTDWSDWHQTKDEDYTWEATVPFDEDANYDISLGYTDLAGHSLEEDYSQSFTVDKTAPDTDKMTVSYSTPLKERILNAITFGYYKESVEITIKAEDLTSGIDYLTWTYVKETGASNNNVAEKTEVISRDALEFTEDGKTATSHFTLKATETEQYRGSISFTATDMAGNISNQKSDNERINVVDNISPTRVVSYSTAKQVVDATTLKTKSSYQYDSENTNSILYYDGDVKVTLRVTEANFYAEDVNVYVNGVRTNPAIWNQVGTTDEWMSGIILSGDGDYWVTMDYTDRSTNEMKTYQSEKIVIDTINPVVSVDYANTNVRKNVGDHKYFNDVQKATIQIKEHNFRADDVVAKVTAKNVSGENVKVPDYAAYLSDRSNWQKNGDVYTAHITYNSDANYTFDIDYKDLALRKAADYKEDFFTVDKTAPTNLNVSYSEGVAGQTLGNVPYHYYNQMITVTISGEDETAGIEHFVYSYRNASGVSKVNAELLEAAIERAKITQHGNKFTATFTIPKSVLQSNNQFNGTVEFTAYDFSTNQKDLKDGSRLVVDNIAPTGSVTFNDPVQEVNGISYYSGNIEATIVINEANFYAEDVQISVEKDGGAGTSVSANWTDNSADIHTGTFTLSDDGDYIVTVNYTDRSSNKMETYTSRQLTIDTQHPTIHVSNIKVNSANKDEKYEFTITATDTADNLPVDEVKPLLKEVTRSEIGTYETKDVPLENITTEVNNQTYSIKVENLEEDGVYTLSCTAKDWANNEYNKFTLDDGQEYENVTFSVNRNGSTFLIDNNTEKMLDKYYVYSVENPVVIKEINTDPIEKYVVKLNGTELEAGEDYITENVNNEGEWNERTYTINKKLFEGEGEYSIVVESTDKAETASYSDIKGLDVSWIVDQTAPVVAVSGLENSGRYKTESQTVTAIPTDDGGKLKSFKAVVADKSGTVKKNNELEGKVLVDLSGEELDTYLGENDGKITFNIPEGLEEQVQIICTDYAVHEDGKTTNEYNEVFSRVTVSANSVIIFYANKPLFYGTIIGIVLTAGGIFLIVWKRKKKKAEGTYKK
ncbi:carboxypeptidase regulatory-like domain-containing protein [[Ruminococcus] lactaris]|uniref:carboxypeptidase regulatory-like domain-containing protein n=1 Tax=[Ruminococcus] lactaris TaxID=46228 RepID=UPI0026650AE9|nr:carboxypeptidase regulatory-like domain-containing protein [[Ruminococcus] lactaris]